jgi:dephospho-CoA kinase
MAIIFITGLSGCGKSATIQSLISKGFFAVDLDEGYTMKVHQETIIDEKKLDKLIRDHQDKNLFISACYSNQGKFYPFFKHVVLLEAPLDVMKERIQTRDSNPYGKLEHEWSEIKESHQDILPLLKQGANFVINTCLSDIDEVCAKLIKLSLES